MRDLVQSLTMIAGLGLETLNADTRQLAIDRAAATLGNALAEFSAVVGQVGISQNAAEAANQRLSSQHVQLAARLDELESIDPAEVAIRISSLSEQLQASYQVTTKLAHLSLVNFI
ncbi:MAG: flagellin [Rhodoblastus sp.]